MLVYMSEIENLDDIPSNIRDDLKPGFVGRDRELDELKDIFFRAKNGEGTTVFISGEAGIGKTRLVEEMNSFAASEGAKIVKGRCLADGVKPLLSIKEALRNADLYHLIAEEPPPKVLSAYLVTEDGLLIAKEERDESELDADIFASMLNAVGNFVKDSLSFMGEEGGSCLNSITYGGHDILIQSIEDLSMAVVLKGTSSEFLIDDMRKKLVVMKEKMGVWSGEMSEANKVQSDVSWFINSGKYDGKFMVDDPKLKQENLFDNVLFGLQRVSKEQPLVFFIDDLQWAGQTSLNILHYLSRNTKDDSIMMIGTYRPEEIIETHDKKTSSLKTTLQNMNREDLFNEIRLERLKQEEVERLIEKAFKTADIDDDFTDKIHEESEGNPFFLLELVDLLVKEGYIIKKEGAWRVERSLDEMNIPTRVYDVINRRLNRLNDDEKNIMVCASVVGEEFESRIVGEVIGINRLELLKYLNTIERKHNVIHSSENRYIFDHSKIKDILYTSINQELRNEYHKIVAESYEDIYRKEINEVLEDIAYHYYKGKDERAVPYLIKAGDKAKDRYENEEAVTFYQDVLELTDDEQDVTHASKGIGEIYQLKGEYEDALMYFEDVKEKDAEVYRNVGKIYQNMGDYDKALDMFDKGMEVAENDEGRAKLLNSKAWLFIIAGRYDEAEVEVEKCMAISEGVYDDVMAECYKTMGGISWYRGDYESAERNYRKGLDAFKKLDDKKEESSCLNNLGLVYQYKGELERAAKYYNRCLDITEEIGERDGIAISLHNLGLVHHDKGELDKAKNYYERSLKIARSIGERSGIAISLNNLGLVYHDKGEVDKALDHHLRSLEIYEDLDAKEGMTYPLVGLGDLYLSMNEPGEALKRFKRGARLAEGCGANLQVSECKRGMGEALIESGRIEDALKASKEAITLGKELGNAEGHAHALRVMGMVKTVEEKWSDAEEAFKNAIDIFKEAGMELDLARVKLEYGKMLINKGEETEGLEILDEIRGFFEKRGCYLWLEEIDELNTE